MLYNRYVPQSLHPTLTSPHTPPPHTPPPHTPAGSALLKPHLGRVVRLWKETFPRSMKELSVEQTQAGNGSLFAVIERRAGALASALRACSVSGHVWH